MPRWRFWRRYIRTWNGHKYKRDGERQDITMDDGIHTQGWCYIHREWEDMVVTNYYTYDAAEVERIAALFMEPRA